MTSENSLHMRMSLIVCAALLGMAIPLECSHAAEAGGSWQALPQDTPYAVRYYDAKSATPRSSGRVEVRTKTLPTDKGNPRIREIESLWEFDCARMLFRNLQTRVAFIDGGVEESHAPYEWSQVHQEIWIGHLWELACKKRENENRVEDAPQ